MGNYTNILEDKLWQLAGEWDETEDDSLAVDFLNAHDTFLSFGEGILRIINKTNPEVTMATATQYLKKSCQMRNVPIEDIASPGTLSNWFSKDMRPKKGEASRRSMFALAFALGLDIDGTQYIFHKVYLDRAFNYRDEKEVIYYYCLKNGCSWDDANEMIHLIDHKQTVADDQTIYTTAIQTVAMEAESDQELVAYIQSHSHNFEKDSVTARQEYSRLLSEAKDVAEQELALPQNLDIYSGKWKNGDFISNNLLYEVITETSVSGEKGTKTVFKNANLPKEIKNRFPEAVTLGKTYMTSEELRKIIILLFSYCVWYRMQWEHIDYDFDDYTSELDALLFSCNYPTLYFGNPFDWMFLYCAQAEAPLDMFRNIIQEVLENSD